MRNAPLFLALGAAALVAVAATAFLGRPDPFLPPVGLGENAFAPVDTAKVRYVRMKLGADSLELVREPGGYWVLPAADNFPANDHINELPDLFNHLKIDDRLSVREADLAGYSLTAETAFQLELLDSARQPVVGILLGCNGPQLQGTYFCRLHAAEALLSFDPKLIRLPLKPEPWLRLQMGMINPAGMLIVAAKPGIEEIAALQSGEQWNLLSLHRNAGGEPLESPEPDQLRLFTGLTSTLACDGLLPTTINAADLGFDANLASLQVFSADRRVSARVLYAPARVMPWLVSNGQRVDEPVLPCKVVFSVAPEARQDAYETWFNAKVGGRLYWIRQSNFNHIFANHAELCIPLPPEHMPKDTTPATQPAPAHP